MNWMGRLRGNGVREGTPSLLPYDRFVDEGICLNKTGELQALFSVDGLDQSSATEAERSGLREELSRGLDVLPPPGWVLQILWNRHPVRPFWPENQFQNVLASMIDEDGRSRFGSGAFHESETFLAVNYVRPVAETRLDRLMMTGSRLESDADEALAFFKSHLPQLAEALPELALGMLSSREHIEVLSSCFSGIRQPRLISDDLDLVDFTVGNVPFIRSIPPEVGQLFVNVLTMTDFPSHTYAQRVSEALEYLNFEVSASFRAVLLTNDEQRSRIERARRYNRQRSDGLARPLLRALGVDAQNRVDLDAGTRVSDCDEALREVASGDSSYVLFTGTLVLRGEDKDELGRRTRVVQETLRNIGISTYHEEGGAAEAYLAALPGMRALGLRRPMLSIQSVADIGPLTTAYTGEEWNPSPLMPPKTPAVFTAVTAGGTPFRFHQHVGDVGHMLIAAAPGGGKTVLALAIALGWLCHIPRSRVYFYDKGHSAEAFARALGADYVMPCTEDGFQPVLAPLAGGITEETVGQVERIFRSIGVDVGGREQKDIRAALELHQEHKDRRLSSLRYFFQLPELRDALEAYTAWGSPGRVLDAEAPLVGNHRLVVVELGNLLEAEDGLIAPVLEQFQAWPTKNATGDPYVVIQDEMWRVLLNEDFTEHFIEGLRVSRKQNGAYVGLTQSTSDILNSPHRGAFLSTCPTRIFTADANAIDGPVAEGYRALGLNDRELELLSRATPKKHYYVSNPKGRRLIDLALSDVARAFLCATSTADGLEARELEESLGEGWQSEWLRRRGLAEWGRHFEDLLKEMEQ